MAAEAFLAVEVIFQEEVAVSLEVTGVFPAVAAVSLAVAVSLGAAAFLAAVVAAFRGAAVVFPTQAAAVPLDRTVFRTILHCSPISADRGRVAVECHRVQPEVNRGAVVHRWAELRHSCRPPTGRIATWEVGLRNFRLAMKAAQEHVQVRFHPRARVEAMPAIFSVSPAGWEPALRSVGQ
jgi:hypothetical protein